MTTSFRQDIRTGAFSVLVTYQAANPTLLNNVQDHPPESFQTPMAYVEKAVSETLTHLAGIRQRVARVNVVIVHKLISNDQATGEQDVLVDGILDAFTAAPHAVSSVTLIEPVAVATDTEITAGEGVRYAAAIITLESSIQEGRL